jgi:hypothetical protein
MYSTEIFTSTFTQGENFFVSLVISRLGNNSEMWNDWLSSLNGPANEPLHNEVPEPIETPKRFNNPQQIERLQSLQAQHQQLQVQQLHLLHRQNDLLKQMGCPVDSIGTDTASTAPQSPSSAVSSTLAEAFKTTSGNVGAYSNIIDSRKGNDMKSEASVKAEDDSEDNSDGEREDEPSSTLAISNETWQQFHALQAQQWAQALNQARIAKRQTATGLSGSCTIASGSNSAVTFGAAGILLSAGSSGSASAAGLSGGKRCKAYAAPKGVWKNNGGYNATIYVHKRRIYGPIRRDLSDAIEDRKEMEEALRELTAIHSSPDDAAILEVEMREVVAGLRNRSTPAASRPDGPSNILSAATSRLVLDGLVTPGNNSDNLTSVPRKRLRLVGGSSPDIVDHQNIPEAIDDVLGPFVNTPQQPVVSSDDYVVDEFNPLMIGDMNHHHVKDEHDMMAMSNHHFGNAFTPQTGPLMYTPSPMLGSGGHDHLLLDDGGDSMLPDPVSTSGGLWGTN